MYPTLRQTTTVTFSHRRSAFHQTWFLLYLAVGQSPFSCKRHARKTYITNIYQITFTFVCPIEFPNHLIYKILSCVIINFLLTFRTLLRLLNLMKDNNTQFALHLPSLIQLRPSPSILFIFSVWNSIIPVKTGYNFLFQNFTCDWCFHPKNFLSFSPWTQKFSHQDTNYFLLYNNTLDTSLLFAEYEMYFGRNDV